MAEFARVHGFGTGSTTTGTLRTTAQLKAYVIRLRSTSNGGNTDIDLQAEDGDGASEPNQLVELVQQELNPQMYFVPSAANGFMHVIVDGHHNDAASIKARLTRISGIGTDTTVTLGTQLTVA